MDMVEENVNFDTWLNNYNPIIKEAKNYKQECYSFSCLAMKKLNELYPEERKIKVVPDSQMRIMYSENTGFKLCLSRYADFKKMIHFKDTDSKTGYSLFGLKTFYCENPIHTYNLYTCICHELGHMKYLDDKIKYIKIPKEVELLIALKETRADIFAKNLMKEIGFPAYFDWFSIKGKYGYLDRKDREDLVENNNDYTIETVNKIISIFSEKYGSNIKERTLNYIKNKYEESLFPYFEELFKLDKALNNLI